MRWGILLDKGGQHKRMIKQEQSENKEPIMHKSGEIFQKFKGHEARTMLACLKKQEGRVVRIYEQQKG